MNLRGKFQFESAGLISLLAVAVQLCLPQPLPAAQVQFDFQTFTSQNVSNKPVLIKPVSPAIALNEWRYTNSYNGTIIVSNIMAGTYDWTIFTPLAPTTRRILVPETTGLVYATNLTTTAAVSQTYTTTASDARFVTKTNGRINGNTSGSQPGLSISDGGGWIYRGLIVTNSSIMVTDTNGNPTAWLTYDGSAQFANASIDSLGQATFAGGKAAILSDGSAYFSAGIRPAATVKVGGQVTLSNLTASAMVGTDAGKNLISVSLNPNQFYLTGGTNVSVPDSAVFTNLIHRGSFTCEAVSATGDIGNDGNILYENGDFTIGGAIQEFAANGNGFVVNVAQTNRAALNVAGPFTAWTASTNASTVRNKGGVTNDSNTQLVGAVAAQSTVNITGASTHGGTATFTNALQAQSTVSITGASTHGGTATFTNGVVNQGNGFVTGTLQAGGVFTSTNTIVGQVGENLTGALAVGGGINSTSTITAAGLNLTNSSTLSLSTNATAADVFVVRDNAPNRLALRNGTTAQAFRVYNTFTDSVNNERGSMYWSGNTLNIGAESSGTGAAEQVVVGSNPQGGPTSTLWLQGTIIKMVTSGNVDCWDFNTSGHLIGHTDNTFDIGASGATRPRTGYFGTSVVTPVAQLNRTANYTVSANEPGTFINNSGATLVTTNTLPASVIGLHYNFVVVTAKTNSVVANGTDTIRNGANVSIAGGMVYSSTIGSTIHLFCPVTGQWFADSVNGTWVVQ